MYRKIICRGVFVHISALSNTFVKDPHSVAKAGDVVKVKVREVDVPQMDCADDAADP